MIIPPHYRGMCHRQVSLLAGPSALAGAHRAALARLGEPAGQQAAAYRAAASARLLIPRKKFRAVMTSPQISTIGTA
jgi:hypothetical protein